MNCLCCGKPLKTVNDYGWHSACLRRFFGSNDIPDIEINREALDILAAESTVKGLTVPGVQKKLSLHLHSEGGRSRLTLVNYPTGYILKPQVEEWEALPEAEQLIMCMADVSGISTVPHGLVKSGDTFAYITKRVDRIINRDGIKKLAMEDFCQLDYRLTADKYRGSYERCAKIIHAHSSRIGLDMSELFMRLVFSFVVGNSDMHLKNFSLIEKEEGCSRYVLSPAYDLVPVNIILPEDAEEFALTMNGKKKHLHKNDFLIFAESCGISKTSALKMISGILSLRPLYLKMCHESLLPDYLKSRLEALLEARCNALQ